MKTITFNDKEGTTHLINVEHIVRVEAYGGVGIMIYTTDDLGIKTELNLTEVKNLLKSK